MTAPSHHPSALLRLADLSYRRRRLMLLLWLVALVGLSIVGKALAGDHSMSFSTPGAESETAQHLLATRFPAASGESVNVVFEADKGVHDPAVQARVEKLVADVGKIGHVASVISPYSPQGAQQISPNGKIAFARAQLDVSYKDDFPVDEARHMITLAKAASGDGLHVAMSGFAIQFAEQPQFGSEGLGILAAVLILLISFGSVLAMGLPILTAIVGLTIGTALIGLLANVLEVPDFAPLVAAMIGIGVGIDYVLFIVTRYRTSLQTGHEPYEAVMTAISTSGRAVLFAGCTVIISLLGLFVMNLGFLRGLSLSCISVVLVVMLASVTLLPALLGFIGKTIDRLHVPFVAKKVTGDRTTLSYKWSRIIQRRPLPFALVCAAVLIGLAIPLTTLRFGFPDAGSNPKHFTSRQGYDLMAKGFLPGVNGPLLLVVEGKGDVQRVSQQVAATKGVAFVAAPVVSPDGGVAMLPTIPRTGPSAKETEQLVHRLRDDVLPAATAGSSMHVYVGGSTAASVDSTEYVTKRLPLFIGAVIILSFLLLMVVFRSILVPVKAAVMNVLSITAAYGVISLAVKGGWFGGLFGINEPVPVPSFVPMMMFAIVFGLSMDYEVFLLSRVREEYSRTHDNASAVADGLAATARVITAAALIMITVFLAFVLGEDKVAKVIGLGLATAIFVDATLVRMVLVPATMELLGDANWWLPKWLDRLLPEFHVEGESEAELEAELRELAHDDAAKVG
jgi:RND superfamily putative drug exporter